MNKEQNKSGRGDAPLWLSTLSALSVFIVLLMLLIIINNQIIKFLLILPMGIFVGIIIRGISRMIKYKSFKITPNEIDKIKEE